MSFLQVACSRFANPSFSLYLRPYSIRAFSVKIPLKFHTDFGTKRLFSQRIFSNVKGDIMKKTGKIGLLILLGGAALASLNLYAQNDPKEPNPVIFSSVEGKPWAENCVQEHPEILWLANANVRKTEEGQPSLNAPYSEQLFGQKFIEFDRTLMTLRCLKLILDGSDQAYQNFTAAQPKDVRLSKKSFEDVHTQGQKLLKSRWGGMSELQMAQAMETALILGDIGKGEQPRELFNPYGTNAPDHDDFYGEAMNILSEHPQLSPSFAKLPKETKNLLVEVANLAHYGHITHLEGEASMFDKLRSSLVPTTDPIALSFDLFVHTCDVAGALGHVNNKSSLVYTEPAHMAMKAMNDSVRILSDPKKTSTDAYNAYLTTRASWLGLDPTNGIDRVLARIGSMLRIFTIEEGAILKQAVALLSSEDRDKIIEGLDIQKGYCLSRTPTYMPAVLVNLLNNPQIGGTKEERLSQAVALGLPFICRVLELHKVQILNHEADPNIPLNFNKMAAVAKTSPNLLASPCSIDHEGNVNLVTP